MASNTTYSPNTWMEIDQRAVTFYSSGVSGIAISGQSTNIDLILSDDVFIRGIDVLVQGANFGDTASIQVIDTNGMTGVPAGTVIAQPVNNWNIRTDVQDAIPYQSAVPKKALATMTIRTIYNSTGLTNVNLALNFNLLKPLF